MPVTVKVTGSGPERSRAARRAAAARSISAPEMAASPVMTAWIVGAEMTWLSTTIATWFDGSLAMAARVRAVHFGCPCAVKEMVTVQPGAAWSSTWAPATSAAVTLAASRRYLDWSPVRSQATTVAAGSSIVPGARPLSWAQVTAGTAYCMVAGSVATSSGVSLPKGARAASCAGSTRPGSVSRPATWYPGPSLACTAAGAPPPGPGAACGVVGPATTARKLSRPGWASSRRPSGSPPAPTATDRLRVPVTVTPGWSYPAPVSRAISTSAALRSASAGGSVRASSVMTTSPRGGLWLRSATAVAAAATRTTARAPAPSHSPSVPGRPGGASTAGRTAGGSATMRRSVAALVRAGAPRLREGHVQHLVHRRVVDPVTVARGQPEAAVLRRLDGPQPPVDTGEEHCRWRDRGAGDDHPGQPLPTQRRHVDDALDDRDPAR